MRNDREKMVWVESSNFWAADSVLMMLRQGKRLDERNGKWIMLDGDDWVDAPVAASAEVYLSDYKLSHSAGYTADFCAQIRAGGVEDYDPAALCSPDEYLGLWNDPLVPTFGNFPSILAERREIGVEAWREKRLAKLVLNRLAFGPVEQHGEEHE